MQNNFGNTYPYGYNQNFTYQHEVKPQIIFSNITGGVDTAKMYPMLPNQIVYLKDDTNNLLFEKKTDQNSCYSFKTYKLEEIKQNGTSDYASTSDLNNLQKDVNDLKNQLNGILNLLQGNNEKLGE